jgi:4-hydroxythreonine-4-phosphate dehydrogenase
MSDIPLPLALTMGEPAGIAPDITLAAWAALRENGPAFVVIGDAAILEARARLLGIDAPLVTVSDPREAVHRFAQALPVLPCRLTSPPASPGKPESASAPAVIAAIDDAVELALQGKVAAVVTNPIQKQTLYAAGFRNEGHTDYLADLARQAGHTCEPVMMLVAGNLRTVPVTVHVPLAEVPARLTRNLIERQVSVLAAALRDRFAIGAPRIAVTGLNPHAGEGGTIGREEVETIAPAVAALAAAGLAVEGPFAADSLFAERVRVRYDAIVCMYHDQALIPVKALGFDEGVNVTLGLPFIRTSPDHGTALALAGTGKASPESLLSAIALAARMAKAAGG